VRACRRAARCAQTYLFSGQTFFSQIFHHVHVTGIPFGRTCARPRASLEECPLARARSACSSAMLPCKPRPWVLLHVPALRAERHSARRLTHGSARGCAGSTTGTLRPGAMQAPRPPLARLVACVLLSDPWMRTCSRTLLCAACILKPSPVLLCTLQNMQAHVRRLRVSLERACAGWATRPRPAG